MTLKDVYYTAATEFWMREDAQFELRRLFVTEGRSDEEIAYIFNHKIRQGGFEGFHPPEGFAISRTSVVLARKRMSPPVTRPPKERASRAKRSALVTLPHRHLIMAK